MKILFVDTGRLDLVQSILTGLENRNHDCRVIEPPISVDAEKLRDDLLWADIVFATYLSMDRWTYALTNLAVKWGFKLVTWTELDMSIFQPVNFWQVNWDGVAACFGDNPAVLRRYDELTDSATLFVYSPRSITQVPFSIQERSPFMPAKGKKFGKKLGLAGAYFRKWKRPFLALECYRRLIEKDPEWTFEMVGSGPEFRTGELENEAANLGVNLLPHLNRINQLISWYQKIDIILNTSDYEGNPKTMAEGMLCGAFPMVRKWSGADEMYLEDRLFDDPDEFVKKTLAWSVLPEAEKRGIMKANHDEILRRYRPGRLTTIAEDTFRVVLEEAK